MCSVVHIVHLVCVVGRSWAGPAMWRWDSRQHLFFHHTTISACPLNTNYIDWFKHCINMCIYMLYVCWGVSWKSSCHVIITNQGSSIVRLIYLSKAQGSQNQACSCETSPHPLFHRAAVCNSYRVHGLVCRTPKSGRPAACGHVCVCMHAHVTRFISWEGFYSYGVSIVLTWGKPLARKLLLNNLRHPVVCVCAHEHHVCTQSIQTQACLHFQTHSIRLKPSCRCVRSRHHPWPLVRHNHCTCM